MLLAKQDTGHWKSALDGFIMVTVGGLAALHLIPEALQHGGPLAIPLVVLGALLPLWSHHFAERLRGRAEIAILMTGLG